MLGEKEVQWKVSTARYIDQPLVQSLQESNSQSYRKLPVLSAISLTMSLATANSSSAYIHLFPNIGDLNESMDPSCSFK